VNRQLAIGNKSFADSQFTIDDSRLLYPHATVDVSTDKLNGKACSIEQARRPASLHFYINELSGEKPG
jgi:hypothetical protein